MDLLFFLLLIGAPFIVFILYLIALVVLKKKKKIRIMPLSIYGWAFVVILIIGLILWQMGPSPSRERIVVTGFSKLRPLAPSIMYTGAIGDFTASFVNTVGTNITITNASVTDKLDESIAWSRPLINDVDPITNPQTMKSGSPFKLNVNDNGAGRYEGDPFDLEITITYTSVMDGIITSHTETGRIRGPVEA